ncbi:MAG: apolipoprotein N-acyltransferase [Limisphaerales bacterium]
MKWLWQDRRLAARAGLAGAAGLLWALAFPTPGIAGLAWAAPGLLVLAGWGLPRGAAFRCGYIAGLVHFVVSLSWLRFIPFPAGAYAGWFALAAFLALFPAAWLVLVTAGSGRDGEIPPLRRLGADIAGWPRRMVTLWPLFSASAWVALDMLRARIFGGFPWNLLGASQQGQLPLIQVASVTGVHGVTFLVAWVSLALLAAFFLLLRVPEQPSRWRRPVFGPLLVVVMVYAWGFLETWTDRPAPRSLRVALVQPSIPQTLIWDPTADDERFGRLLELTRGALATRPDLVIWPEASLPGGITAAQFGELREAVRGAGAWFVFGADDAEPGDDPDRPVYNAAFLMNPAGEVVARYHKRKLVIFGEYIPFERWLPWLGRLIPAGGFTAGRERVAFDFPELGARAAVLICFEDCFPHEARRHATPDVDFLLNLTNNGWFGEAAAQWQHAQGAVFRAVENGRPLVRAANNGLTCWVDARGRVFETQMAGRDDIYGPGFKVVRVPLADAPRATFYNRFGDVFGWGCVAAVALVQARRWRERRAGG